MMRTVEERAEGLRVMLKMAPFLPDEHACLAVLDDEEYKVFEARDDDVVHLANACIAVEREMRTDAVCAIERLGALVTEGEGDLDRRVNALSDERFVLALSAMRDAFWVYD
jgi:hypothetical protein